MAARTHRTLAMLAVALVALVCALGATVPAQAGSPITYADPGGSCASLTPCYTTVQKAVDHAGGPEDAQVWIFPGTYSESVDLTLMASEFNHVAGNISLITVDVSASPVKHTATINGADPVRAVGFTHDVTIDGLVLEAITGDGANIDLAGDATITVRNSKANNAGNRGFKLDTVSGEVTVEGAEASHNFDGFEINAGGSVMVTDVEADGNDRRGLFIETGDAVTLNDAGTNDNGPSNAFGDGVTIHAGLDVTVSNLTAQRNGDDGLDVEAGGELTINGHTNLSENTDGGADLTAAGFTITDSIASANNGIGWELQDSGAPVSAGGDAHTSQNTGEFVGTNFVANSNGADGLKVTADVSVTIDQATLSNNRGFFSSGAHILAGGQSVSIKNSLFAGNGNNGILMEEPVAGDYFIRGNVMCDNAGGGLDIHLPSKTVDAEGNWWGNVSGPKHASNPGGTGDEVYDGPARGTVDFVQWISQIEPTQLAEPASVVGVNNAIVYVFTTEDRSTQFKTGPGSDIGTLPFVVSTDNGVVTFGTKSGPSVNGRIENSQLRVGIVAAHTGVANVTLAGPCGLASQLVVHVDAGAKKGDLNCNDGIDMQDLMRSLRYASDLPIEDISGCPYSMITLDLNCNGVTSGDGVDPLLIVLKMANVAPGALLPAGCGPIGE